MAKDKIIEHHNAAAEHHEHAAKHHREAAKHHDADSPEKAAHHAHSAHGHSSHAAHHAGEASKITPSITASTERPRGRRPLPILSCHLVLRWPPSAHAEALPTRWGISAFSAISASRFCLPTASGC